MRLIYLAIIVLLTSCSESVLSDMEIDDPQLLKVKVKIEQNEDNDREVQVFIRDSKNHPVDLLDGRVVVNEHTLRYSRATVNSAGARGYIYTPYYDEDFFEITIFWNSIEGYTFWLDPDTGWDGFYCYDCCACGSSYFISDRYSLKPAPFYGNEIEVAYNILRD